MPPSSSNNDFAIVCYLHILFYFECPQNPSYIIGARHRILVPLSALFGASFVLLCDTLSRTLFSPYEIPVGIVLSLLGGPFFLFLIVRKKGGKLE